MEQQGKSSNAPVVKEGETLQAWLRRAVPYLMQVEKLDEAEAKKVAGQAWNRVNGDGKQAAQNEAQANSETQSTDKQGQPAATLAKSPEKPSVATQQAKPQMDWNDTNTWGQRAADATATDWGDSADDSTEDPSANDVEDGGPTPFGWYAEQIESYANALMDQMLTAGHFDRAQQDGIQIAVNEAIDELQEKLDALTVGGGEAFSFEISVPPPGFFNGGAKKSMDGVQRRVPALQPTNGRKPTADPEIAYMPVDESSPTEGYAVPLPTQKMAANINELTVADIEQFVADNGDALGEGVHLSGEYDTESGQVHLSLVQIAPDAAQATALCQQYQCDHYLDIAASKMVPIEQPKPQKAPMSDGQKSAYLSKFFTTKGIQGPYILNLPNRFSALDGDLAIKSLGKNRVGNYLCVWGNPAERDLSGEWFSPRTGDLTAVFDVVGVVPAMYHHAMDRSLKSAVIGLVDRMERDDVGLWVEAQVREHEMYKRMIMPLINQKKLGWSSGTLPGAREVNKSTGEITRWTIVEATMTPTPMEWRMATQWQVQNIKSAYQGVGLSLPDFTFDPKAREQEIKSELERIEALARQF